MAIPKTLKHMTEESARKIIFSHPEGQWDGEYMNSDFIYEGRKMPTGGRRLEMIRVFRIWGKVAYSHGVVCN